MFEFIIPIAKVSSGVKTRVKEMNEEFVKQQGTTPSKKPANTTTTDGEYIEFEEMK